MRTPWVPLGRLADLERTPVEVRDDQIYQKVGVRGFGRGIFDYEPAVGSELGKLRFYHLRPNRLVVSNIKGWEGAVAVTPPDEAGRVASNRFLTYRLHGANLNFVRQWLLSERGIRALQAASPGSADRNRTLSIRGFESISVPLPRRADQDRIANHLHSIESRAAELARQAPQVSVIAQMPRLLGAVLERIRPTSTSMAELCTNQQVVIHPGNDLQGASTFIGLEHVESHTGRASDGRTIGDEKGRKLLFRPGQVTYGYLRPYLNKAWAADRTGLCSVEQFTLTPEAGVDPRVLSVVLRSQPVWLAAQEATNGLQLPRLSLGTLMAFRVPDVRGLSWTEIAVEVERITQLAVDADRLRARAKEIQASLLPSARNEIFSAMR